MVRQAIWALALCTAVASCAAPRPQEGASTAVAVLNALSPARLGDDMSLSQAVRGGLAGHNASMRMELEVTGSELALAGLTPAGIPLFTLMQSGADISIKSNLPDSGALDFRYLLADIKLVYWPQEALNLALGPTRMRVTESRRQERRVRNLVNANGETLVSISYPQGPVPQGVIVLRRFDIPYRLHIRTFHSTRSAQT